MVGGGGESVLYDMFLDSLITKLCRKMFRIDVGDISTKLDESICCL